MNKLLALVVATICFFGFGVTAWSAPAPDGNSVLILGTTIGPASPSLEESKAAALGYTVVVASALDWAGMTASDFASYKAVVLGDRSCSIVGTSPDLDAALANRAVWTPAITGNVVVVGTDPTFHSSFYAGGLPVSDGDQVAASGIAFAASEPGKTGAYIAARVLLSRYASRYSSSCAG